MLNIHIYKYLHIRFLVFSRITVRAHAYDPSTREAEAGSPPKFKDSLGEKQRETEKQTNK